MSTKPHNLLLIQHVLKIPLNTTFPSTKRDSAETYRHGETEITKQRHDASEIHAVCKQPSSLYPSLICSSHSLLQLTSRGAEQRFSIHAQHARTVGRSVRGARRSLRSNLRDSSSVSDSNHRACQWTISSTLGILLFLTIGIRLMSVPRLMADISILLPTPSTSTHTSSRIVTRPS